MIRCRQSLHAETNLVELIVSVFGIWFLRRDIRTWKFKSCAKLKPVVINRCRSGSRLRTIRLILIRSKACLKIGNLYSF